MRSALLALAALAALLSAAAAGKDPYRILGVGKRATHAEIKKAHKKLAIQYHPDKNPTDAAKDKFIEIQEAYEVLTDDNRRRMYDQTGFYDEKEAAMHQQRQQQYHQQRFQQAHFHHQGGGRSFHRFHHPVTPIESATTRLTHRNFEKLVLEGNEPWLIKIYADESEDCHRASPLWEAAAKGLDGVAMLGRVDFMREQALLRELLPPNLFVQAPTLWDLPLVYGYHPRCKRMGCKKRFKGPTMRSDELQNFMVETILKLPQVPSHTRDSLPSFLAGSPEHKVQVVAFSTRGGHASPLLRKVASDFLPFLDFARVQYRASDRSHWAAELGVREAPAVAVIRPGEPAVVHHGNLAKGELSRIAKESRFHPLPQLRSESAPELGCAATPAGQARRRAGPVCVVAAGPRGEKLAASRRMLRSVQEALGLLSTAPGRVVITWLDAAEQPAFCRHHGACGGDGVDMFAFRYNADGGYEVASYTGPVDDKAQVSAWVRGLGSDQGAVMTSGPAAPKLNREDGPEWLHLLKEAMEKHVGERVEQVKDLVAMVTETAPAAIPIALVLAVVLLPQLLGGGARAPSKKEMRSRERARRAAEGRAEGGGEGGGAGGGGEEGESGGAGGEGGEQGGGSTGSMTPGRLVRLSARSAGWIPERGVYIVTCLLPNFPTDSPEEETLAETGRETVTDAMRECAARFRSEKRLCFTLVDCSLQPSWTDITSREGGREGDDGEGPIRAKFIAPVIIWHPSRAKMWNLQVCAIGGGGRDEVADALAVKLERVLSGEAAWEKDEWPELK